MKIVICELFYLLSYHFIADKVQRNEPTSVLFVANISFNTTTSGLAAAFSGCTDARIMTYPDSGKSKG